LQNHPMITFTN